MTKNIIKMGPWGGSGGSKWYDGNFTGVREIKLRGGFFIDSMIVVYDNQGVPVAGDQHGGPGGDKTYSVTLRYPQEFLTAVSGTISNGGGGGTPVIRSLRFESNLRSFGPFGAEEGVPFSSPMEGGKIVGFLGRSGAFLDAIGYACTPVGQNETSVNQSQPEAQIQI